MSDPSGCDYCCAGLCGGCCIACTESLNMYCFSKAYGSGTTTNRQAGCCGSCCNKSFDEDDQFAARQAADAPAVNTQPAARNSMSDKPPPSTS
ncbi:hypothetical protein C8T65DRAFT_742738 [Cerioporus squamosus]|nr:hypothetical protein C8T65DRAFT_742738 [Cerioporus squamosus]